MQPARLGALVWCLGLGALLGMVLPPPSHAQAVLETPQQVNDRIRELSATLRMMPHDYVIGAGDVLADAVGMSRDAGATVIAARTSPDAKPDMTEPAVIGPEQQPPATGPGNPTRPHDVPSASSPSETAAASANPPAPAEPPPLTNIITINLSELMETGDTKNNMTLQAGDIVTVPHAGIVYVLGAVNRAGGFVLANDRSQLSTLKILALAGGLTRTAKSDKAVIVRKDNQGQQHEVPVDLKKVLNRRAEDLQLQPSDILYVPESGAKHALFRAAEFGIALGSGVALYRIAYH